MVPTQWRDVGVAFLDKHHGDNGGLCPRSVPIMIIQSVTHQQLLSAVTGAGCHQSTRTAELRMVHPAIMIYD